MEVRCICSVSVIDVGFYDEREIDATFLEMKIFVVTNIQFTRVIF